MLKGLVQWARSEMTNKRGVLHLAMFLIATILLAYWIFTIKDELYWWYAVLFTYPIAFVVAGTLRLLFLVRIPKESFILFHGHATHVFEKSTWVWRKQYKEYLFGGKAMLVSYAVEWGKVNVEVNGDPAIVCGITICRRPTKDAFLMLQKLLSAHDQLGEPSLEELVQFMGCEFVKRKRVELDKLYNPADKTQQEAYCDLLVEFLEEFAGEGDFLYISAASRFDLLSRLNATGKMW